MWAALHAYQEIGVCSCRELSTPEVKLVKWATINKDWTMLVGDGPRVPEGICVLPASDPISQPEISYPDG